MREFLREAPWWVVGAVQGVVFGVLFGLTTAGGRGESWVGVVLTVVFTGGFFGVGMGLVTRRQRRRHPHPLAGLDAAGRRAAERAAVRGPVPTDPATRGAAAVVAADQLELMAKGRTQALLVFPVLLVLFLSAAITVGGWLYWVAALGMAGVLVQVLSRPRRLRQRLALLTGEDGRPDEEPRPWS